MICKLRVCLSLLSFFTINAVTHSQHTSTVLTRVHFAKDNQGRELDCKVVSSLFPFPKFEARTQTLFHIMLSPFLLKSAASFFI